MKKSLFISIIAILCSSIIFAQTADYKSIARIDAYGKEIFPEAFDNMLLRDAIVYYLNKELAKNNERLLTPHESLQNVSQVFAEHMSNVDDARISNAPKKLSITNRLLQEGVGIHHVEEISLKALVVRGKTLLTYDEVAQEIIFQFFKRRTSEVLTNPKYIFTGVGCELDKAQKKVFVTLSFGNYNLLSMDKKDVKASGLSVGKSDNGLKEYDERLCKPCEKFKNISKLQEGLKVEDGEIYFTTNDYRSLKKLMRYPNDGLAVDVVYEQQYPCRAPNIVNKQMQSKGELLKPVYYKSFTKKNLLEGREATTSLRLFMGKLPAGASNYELNLVVIKDKHACKNIYAAYNKKFETTEKVELTAYPDTISKYNTYIFKPVLEIDTIRFVIPFESGRTSYKLSDIQLFIDSLEQPSFKPLSVRVTAYSSIEGAADKNAQLRDGRVESILNALRQYSNNSAPITTESMESWSLFKKDIVATEFQFLRTRTNDEVLAYLKQGDNLKKMEPILQKHRFAQIDIRAEYDISTPQKEQEYVLYAFHKAIKDYDDVRALAIQKYIMKQVLDNRYSRLTIDKMEIPDKPAYSGLQMNKVWLHYTARRLPIDLDFLREMRRLSQLDSENPYIKRNWVFARMILESIDSEFYVEDMQKEIDALMLSSLPKYSIDPINLEFQIKSLLALNKTYRVSNEEAFIDAAFERIKGIIQTTKFDWKEAMVLSSILLEMDDYEYPVRLMAPLIYNPSVSEDFIFTFLAICTHLDYMHHTQIFMDAVNKATNMNKHRFCDLLHSGQISFQLLENPEFKKEYCTMCNK